MNNGVRFCAAPDNDLAGKFFSNSSRIVVNSPPVESVVAEITKR